MLARGGLSPSPAPPLQGEYTLHYFLNSDKGLYLGRKKESMCFERSGNTEREKKRREDMKEKRRKGKEERNEQ